MATRKNSFYSFRRVWQSLLVFLFAGAFAAVIIHSPFSIFWKDKTGKIAIILMFLAWITVFGATLRRKFSDLRVAKKNSQWLDDLEFGFLLVVGVYGVIQSAGGVGSPLYPVIFALISFLIVYLPLWSGLVLVGSVILMEVSLAAFSPVAANVNTLIIHIIFILFFSLINLLFTRIEAIRIRRRSDKSLAKAMAAMESEARDFRLVSSFTEEDSDAKRRENTEKLARSSMSQLKGAMHYHVDLLKRTMGLNTCAVLWLDSGDSSLKVREYLSDTNHVVTNPFDKGEGIIGAVIRNMKTLKLTNVRQYQNALTYYYKPTNVTDFIGVPIVDGEIIKGVFIGDRIDEREFTDDDVQIFESSVDSLLNIIFNERVFNQLQKSKSEQEKLLRASDLLSKDISGKNVVRAALEAAMEIVDFETGVLTKISGPGHVILHATGTGSDQLPDGMVIESSSLVCTAVKNRHYLPNRGKFDSERHILISGECRHVFSKMRSALVLPLFSGNIPLGSMILASSQPGLFDEEIRTTLQVMVNQLGTALKNAQMYQELEDLATTDGLTGLPNHRVFQEELSRRIASAMRNRSTLSLIFCDVDKFKGVNDTYGHPMGDMVLRGLSEILKKNMARKTDMAARYGGEEFAIILEGTDTRGAVKLANRIRKDFEKKIFQTDSGPLSVTISMGVATCPDHAESNQKLIEMADTALYAAKKQGRNRVCVFDKGAAEK